MKKVIIPVFYSTIIIVSILLSSFIISSKKDGKIESFEESKELSENEVFKTNPSLLNGSNNSFHLNLKGVRFYYRDFIFIKYRDSIISGSDIIYYNKTR